ncbi:Glycosyltransferase, catalytic subunit of cellulose synthase and poly-beta-1,6-N-acetylglucosamine synthase [Ruminococcaceae bacterium FB2012]|nr:Glycosyltransferase, catalytic subunit of cellulose synthase and poly-beta-1,6-N-acetylglucosamine synthase [Ruminococcaceae bacterium FB2012]
MISETAWWVSVFTISEAMIGYPISLIALNKIMHKTNNKNIDYEPTVTLMIVAHNEEKVIKEKLDNAISLNYPKEKYSILVASDFSTDSTNTIVERYIEDHPNYNIRLHKSAKHMGKTNAQNEAQKYVKSEILVMTDANSIFEKDAIKELVSSFSADNIAYVSGQLIYLNTKNNKTAKSEGFYWKLDLLCREIESNIQTITAGNGAIYACRNKSYLDIKPIECHDSKFPLIFALQGNRAIYNKKAIAYEKAGEVDSDEFKRKTRMNREILKNILPSLQILNIKKYRWFSYFYFGHRTCRYLLWIMHLLAFIFNIKLFKKSKFWKFTMVLQTAFYGTALWGWKKKNPNRVVKIITYYCMTVLAQWIAVYKIITGQSKPVWEKAESTR